MEFKIKTGELAKHKTPCLVLGVFEKRKLCRSRPGESTQPAEGDSRTSCGWATWTASLAAP